MLRSFPGNASESRADYLDKESTTWYVRFDGDGPYTSTIGQGRNTPVHEPDMLTVDADAGISVVNANAISVGDNITINVNGTVTGTSSTGGIYGTGPNVIEGNSNMTIYVNAGATVQQLGTTSNGEAINLHGFANQIVNYGTIKTTQNAAAIWFQDVVSSGGDPNLRNIVTNYGTIEQSRGSNVMGTSAGNGIIFYNKSTGVVKGNLVFAQGNDDLYFEAGSSVTGNIDGGGGINSLYLDGDESLGVGTLTGWVHNFQTLTKTGTGTWDISGSLQGFNSTTVDEGVLRITGNNANYTGTLLINASGTVEARPRSLPTNNPSTGYTNNIYNNGTLRFVEQDTSNDNIYNGQIVGTGRVEMTEGGVVRLAPVSGANTYSGGTYIENGTIAINSDAALGAVSGPLVLGDGNLGGDTIGTLRFDAQFNLDANRKIQLVGQGGRIDTQDYTTTISQAFAFPSSSLYKTGDGTLILTGDSSLMGSAFVEEGILQIGDGNENGSLKAIYFDVSADAALAYDRSDDQTVSTTITGDGRVIQRGSGTLDLTNSDNTFTGGTEIENGRILIADTDAYNKTDGKEETKGTNAGHFLYSTVNSGAAREIEVGASIDKLQNHFHVAGGDNNVFKTTDDLTISGVVNNSTERLLGGAFYVGNGTLNMDLGGNLNLGGYVDLNGDLILDENKDGEGDNDIYIASGGTLNMNVQNAGKTATIYSGMAGSGDLNLTGLGTVILNKNSSMGNTDVQSGTLQLNNVDYTSPSFTLQKDATLSGAGTVIAGATTEIYGHLNPDGSVGNPFATLTLNATGGSIVMSGFSMDFDISKPSNIDGDRNPTVDQDLLVIKGPQVQNFSGSIDFHTHEGFDHGYYLVIRSDNGFDYGQGNVLDGINNTNGVLKATIDGFDARSKEFSPRGTIVFNHGVEENLNEIWLANTLNSLTMDWTGTGGSVDAPNDGYWENGNDLMRSEQSLSGDVREFQFLSGDKVHIYNTSDDPANTIAVSLERALQHTATNPIVSGLVVGQSSDGDDDHVGNVLIKGAGGITTNNSAFGIYVGTSLIPTGMLQKYGISTLTFENEGGNLFNEGVELHGGTTAFSQANQLAVGTDKAITFVENATLKPIASFEFSTPIVINGGVTGTFDVDVDKENDPIGLFLDGNVNGPGNLVKTGAGVLQFADKVATTNNITNTTVEAGKFRIVDGKAYNSTGDFTLNKGAELSGGGTVVAGSFVVNGKISADKGTMTPDDMVVTGDERIGTLTLQGTNPATSEVEFTSEIVGTEREGFNFDYRVTAPDGPNDLLKIVGMNSVQLQGGVINVMTDTGSLTKGDYLIIDSNTAILNGSGAAFDNTKGNKIDGIKNRESDDMGAVWGKINDKDIISDGPRGDFEFVLREAAKQLWLTVSHNTLQSVWQGGSGLWSTGKPTADGSTAGWESEQFTTVGLDDIYDYNFFDGDLAYFKDTATPSNYTVTVDRDIIVSGVDVDTAQNITFDGSGGITAKKTDTDLIIGDYANAPSRPDNQEFDTTGKLVKHGEGTLTLSNTGDNEFQEGVDIYEGDIVLAGTEANRLGKYGEDVTLPNAGQVTFKYVDPGDASADDTAKSVVIDTAQTLQNRFVVEENVKDATITANAETKISGVVGPNINPWGGAVLVNEGAVLAIEAKGGNITFENNTHDDGTPNDIRIVGNGQVDFNLYSHDADPEITGDEDVHHHVFIKSGISSFLGNAATTINIGNAGTDNGGRVQISFATGSDRYNGTTNVNSAGLRVVDGVTFGSELTSIFNLGTVDGLGKPDNDQAWLEGNGTIAGTVFTIGGHVSPDGYDLSDTTMPKNQIGRLTLQSDTNAGRTVTFKSEVDTSPGANDRIGFHFDYDVVGPTSAGFTNDLLQIIGMDSVKLEGGVVNFRTGADGLGSGSYLIINSWTTITDGGGDAFGDGTNGTTVLDGINNYDNARGVLWGKLNGEDMRPNNPRADREFVLRDAYGGQDNQIWLDVERNTLKTVWTGGKDSIWTTGGNWKSEQFVTIDGSPQIHDDTFNNGDYVVFGDGTYTVTLPEKVIVSGMDAALQVAGSTVTFDGPGGIRAIQENGTNENYIEGRYANTDHFQHFDTTGKLVKTGDGTLVFRNTGGNDFTEGIELGGGVTAFDLANQLGNKLDTSTDQYVGNEITFTADSTLRADDSVSTYNETTINTGKTATFEVVDEAEWKFAGKMIGVADTKLDKTGLGTLSLYNASGQTESTFAGSVDVSAGKLAVYGNYGNTDSFEVKNGATLSGTGTLGSQNGGVIRSGGHLAPGGLSTFANAETAPAMNPLTINGDLTFESGSNFDVRITQYGIGADGKRVPYSDQVVVNNGVVDINSDAILNVDIDFWGTTNTISDFNADESGHFTIIDAGNNTQYSADQVFGELNHTLLPRGVVMKQGWYDEQSLFQLWFEKGNGFQDLCPQHNRNEIGQTLDQLVWSRDPGMHDLIMHLSAPCFSDGDVCKLLDQLTGDLSANAMMMAMHQPWRHPFNRLSLDNKPSCNPCDPCAPVAKKGYKRELWGEFYGRYDDVNSDGNAHSYTINRYGVAVGIDQRLSKNATVGVTFNYSDPRLRQATGKVEMDDFEIGLYNLTRFRSGWDMKFYAGYSHQRYNLDRRVYLPECNDIPALSERFRNKVDGDAFAASIELIRPLRYWSDLVLLPTIAFDFEQAWMKGYRESGGLTALQYDKSTLERMMLRFGLGAEYAARRNLDLKARIQYATQVNSNEYPNVGVRFVNSTVADQRTASIRGSRIGRDYLNLGIGADWKLNTARSFILYVNYDADLYRRATIHAGEFGLVRQW